jgi:hypothetical protein
MQDLQLWYSKVCLLQFKNFEKNPPEQGYPVLFGARTRGNVGTHDLALGHVGFTTVRRRTRTPRQTGDHWSVRGAEALLCVVLWAPDSRHALRLHASVGPAAFGHWPVAPPAGRHWSSPLAPPLPHAATHCATTLVIPSPRHTAYKRPADLLLTRPRVRRRPPLAFLGELPCPFEPRTF